MKLVLDIGNTLGKLVVYEQEDEVFKTQFELGEMYATLIELFLNFPEITQAILCSVVSIEPQIQLFLKEKTILLKVNSQLKLPFENRYETPETLGADRIGLVAAAVFKYPGKNCLVVDAGSCVTYDFISSDGIYRGGAISPGIQMRFKAMHEHTNKLPFVTLKEEFIAIGANTQNSILAGAVNGLVFEIEGWQSSLERTYEDLTLILTGGDAQFLSKRLKNTIFAHSNFLVQGLRQLLDYNTL
jgi:type III pantothenate kinase